MKRFMQELYAGLGEATTGEDEHWNPFLLESARFPDVEDGEPPFALRKAKPTRDRRAFSAQLP